MRNHFNSALEAVGVPRRNQSGTTQEPLGEQAGSGGGFNPVGVNPPNQARPVAAFQSRYVRRCARCRQVRGISSFAKAGKSYTNVCRTCRDREANQRKDIRVEEWALRGLRRTERELRRQLDSVGRKIARLERNVAVKRLEFAAEHDRDQNNVRSRGAA